MSDTVTRLRNGGNSQKASVEILKSKNVLTILNILVDNGFIAGYHETKPKGKSIKKATVQV